MADSSCPYGEVETLKFGSTVIEMKANSGDAFVVEEIWKKKEYTQCTYNPTDFWLDLGAHVGSFALWASPKVNQIISLEPDPRQLYFAERNLKRNNIDNVLILPGAVVADDRKETTLYYKEDGHRAENTVIPVRGRSQVTVDCYNINELIQDFRPNKIKMDIEGIELDVCRAITPDNWEGIEEIILEFHLRFLKDWPEFTKWNEMLEILKKNFSHVEAKENPKKSWFELIYARK